MFLQATADPALNQIFDKIRVAVFKNGIRTIEFFKDHDKLRSGIITENQFVCGLALAVGKEAQLSRAEIQKIVEYYRQPDGRVLYKEFCDVMENGEYILLLYPAFTDPQICQLYSKNSSLLALHVLSSFVITNNIPP